jgi:2-dehydropantoate 2-reductase
VVIGEYDGRPSERTQAIAHAFRESGIDARVSDHIEADLWQKFVFIAALAASCGLARSAVGPLRADPLGRRLLQRATQEVLAVAAARGVALPEGEAVRVLSVIDGLPPAMKPSFLLDLEAGGPTELDALCGTVSRFAEQAGLAVPIHDTATFVLGRQPTTPQAG